MTTRGCSVILIEEEAVSSARRATGAGGAVRTMRSAASVIAPPGLLSLLPASGSHRGAGNFAPRLALVIPPARPAGLSGDKQTRKSN